MNIFYVDICPIKAARSLCDAHVVKMIIESAQMLHACHVMLDKKEIHRAPRFPISVLKHPCTLWAGKTSANYTWLWDHMRSLANEYEFRYGKTSEKFEQFCSSLIVCPDSLGSPSNATPPALAMPDMFKRPNPVEAYREYYRFKSRSMPRFTYTRRSKPSWL